MQLKELCWLFAFYLFETNDNVWYEGEFITLVLASVLSCLP